MSAWRRSSWPTRRWPPAPTEPSPRGCGRVGEPPWRGFRRRRCLERAGWMPEDAPAELVRTQHRSPPGIVVHSGAVRDDEMCTVRAISCTTPARTAYDLGRHCPFTVGVIRVDAVLAATGIAVDDVAEIARRNPGTRHIRRLRRVLEIADGGAESTHETRLRLVLVRAGLPRPVTQIPICNSWGRVIRRIDLGWPQWKAGVEYDGAQHWTDRAQQAEDIDRLEFFADLGWRRRQCTCSRLYSRFACNTCTLGELNGWLQASAGYQLPV